MVGWPRLNEWMARYEMELRRLRKEQPGRYLWPDDQLPDVVLRMRQSFAAGPGHYNKDSLAIRATCKHFRIAMTYSSIERFIRSEK